MARARNIKPSFFTNDLLAELPPLTRILFAGLWTIADREGRLEDRPARIRAEVLPYDSHNVDDALTSLHESGFILRYAVKGAKYIQVLAFNKHQNPHVRELSSAIPAPVKHRTSTVLGREKPEPAGPITDSLLLIPDSLSTLPITPEVWQSWAKHRGKSLTAESVKRQSARLIELHKAGHDPNKVIGQSIERGWSGLFEIKPERLPSRVKEDRRAATAHAIFGNQGASNDEPRDITADVVRVG